MHLPSEAATACSTCTHYYLPSKVMFRSGDILSLFLPTFKGNAYQLSRADGEDISLLFRRDALILRMVMKWLVVSAIQGQYGKL